MSHARCRTPASSRESVHDPQGQLRRTQQKLYDYINRLQKGIGAAGQATTYGYAGDNSYWTVTDPLFRKTTNYKDVFDRLNYVTDP
ncbi:MAG TPA: hypothetical protein VFV55_03040, partial [Usitatibacteraceae bacterium]|nr:hypothetical protein [Usitatibacteraceae bacterium]